jgi:hypothetical protein
MSGLIERRSSPSGALQISLVKRHVGRAVKDLPYADAKDAFSLEMYIQGAAIHTCKGKRPRFN